MPIWSEAISQHGQRLPTLRQSSSILPYLCLCLETLLLAILQKLMPLKSRASSRPLIVWLA